MLELDHDRAAVLMNNFRHIWHSWEYICHRKAELSFDVLAGQWELDAAGLNNQQAEPLSPGFIIGRAPLFKKPFMLDVDVPLAVLMRRFLVLIRQSYWL
jgi:hypothetical protein